LVVDGVTLFAKDTSVSGKVLNVEEPGRVKGVASISLQLTEIQPRKGSPLPLETQPFSETAKAEKRRTRPSLVQGRASEPRSGQLQAAGKVLRWCHRRWRRQ
jgi:hypothetical protein